MKKNITIAIVILLWVCTIIAQLKVVLPCSEVWSIICASIAILCGLVAILCCLLDSVEKKVEWLSTLLIRKWSKEKSNGFDKYTITYQESRIEIILSSLIRMALAIGLVIMGAKLADSMKATSLMKLGEGSQRIQDKFSMAAKSMDKVAHGVKEYDAAVREIGKNIDTLEKRLKSLDDSIGAAKQRVDKIQLGGN